MKTKIAFNGFGRIGRGSFKVAFERPDLQIVAINDLVDAASLAHLLKHDSTYGEYQKDVGVDGQSLVVDAQKILVLNETDPAKLPWKDLGVEVVVECTGSLADTSSVQAHIAAGAKKVLLAEPAKGEGVETIIIGVNEDKLPAAGEIISAGSCTTNCIAPVAAVIEDAFGIERAMMTTVHSYTSSQRLLDGPGKDIRSARGAATNIVPSTTGASAVLGKVVPALENRFNGLALRVPTPVVSLGDLTVVTKKTTTAEEVNEVFKKAAADTYYQGILSICEEPLVSSDFIGNSHSAIVDLGLTSVVSDNLLKVVAWYDNEWGYCNRLVELAADVGRLLHEGQATATTETEGPQEDTAAEFSDENAQAQPIPDQPETAKEPEPLLDPPDEELLPPPEKTDSAVKIPIETEP